jgi:hypothetical protein
MARPIGVRDGGTVNSLSHIFLRPKDSIVCHPTDEGDVDLTIRSDREPGRLTITGTFADLRRLHVVIGSCLAVFDTAEAARLRPVAEPDGSTDWVDIVPAEAATGGGDHRCPVCDGFTAEADRLHAEAATEWEPDIATGIRNCPGEVP